MPPDRSFESFPSRIGSYFGHLYAGQSYLLVASAERLFSVSLQDGRGK